MKPLQRLNIIPKPKRKRTVYRGVKPLQSHTINLLELLQAQKGTRVKGVYIKRGTRGGSVDYDHNSFCTYCGVRKPKEMIKCDECHRLVSHTPARKTGKYWKDRLVYY